VLLLLLELLELLLLFSLAARSFGLDRQKPPILSKNRVESTPFRSLARRSRSLRDA
jgi:hypothetical protein